MAEASVVMKRAQHADALISRDFERLNLVDRYARGYHRAPYVPRKSNPEFKDLVKRSITNVMPLVIDTPANALRVEGYRRSGQEKNAPEWEWWQKNRLDDRQAAVHRAALADGIAYVVVTPDPRRGKRAPVVRAFPAINTVAVYQDPTADEFPLYALHVPKHDQDSGEHRIGVLWDDVAEYTVDFDAPGGSKVVKTVPHGLGVCPVVQFTPGRDLHGRALGVVEPLIVVQDKLNQQVLSLLLAEHWGAHAIRFGTGLAPTERLDEFGDPITDEKTGEILYDVPTLDPSTLLMAPNADAKFGQLPAMPTADLRADIDQTMQSVCAISQTPPHYLMADMVNLSADALVAAESAFQRRLTAIQDSFGEAWESVLRLIARIAGSAGTDDESGQVTWADKGNRSLAQAADALTKLMQQGVPLAVALRKVPGFSQADVDESVKAAEEAARKAETAERRAMSDGVGSAGGRDGGSERGVRPGSSQDR
ncbi:phage portal protein [Kitasatospora purpeofusca]|uniref:phage portal protein n=1 Tax=Kitasatospora purpeofusca TaxID=67352 RepID=UPI0036B9C93D